MDDEKLKELFETAEKLGLDVLVEVHTLEELRRAEKINPRIIGINNRDLHTFEVSLETSRELIGKSNGEYFFISESGLKTKEDLQMLKKAGFKGFLIGETLMKSEDVGKNSFLFHKFLKKIFYEQN